ncbi:hypothetical protein BDY24DRAFT_340939, partial [Mrakia frigida]|uniref:Dsc2p n=1 Tax=Mrakia frigida TaxID=29902 RepID=UPI003FCBF4F3
FSHAPLTKGMMLFVGISSLGVALLHWKPYLPLILEPHLTKHHQFWRLATQPFAFINSSELFLWELLIYTVGRHVERCLGSRKFATFLLLSHLLSTFLSFLFLLSLATSPFNTLHPGPTSLAFAILFLYNGLVPTVYTFTIMGLSWTDKIYPFVIASQLLTPHLPLLLPPLTGFLSAHLLLLSRSPSSSSSTSLLNTYHPHLPLPLQRFSQTYLLPLLGTFREPKRSTNAWPAEALVAPTAYGLSTAVAAEPATTTTPTTVVGDGRRGQASVVSQWVDELTVRGGSPRVPTEGEVATLQGMFPSSTRTRVVRALQQRFVCVSLSFSPFPPFFVSPSLFLPSSFHQNPFADPLFPFPPSLPPNPSRSSRSSPSFNTTLNLIESNRKHLEQRLRPRPSGGFSVARWLMTIRSGI